MVRIQKLGRPNKHSGYKLDPNKTTIIAGLTIVNGNNFHVFVDRFSRKKSQITKAKKKSSKK
jgi:hypothetical protein